MEIGTILVNRWGYEQTNVDFFQVIKVTEKTVVIRQIAKETVKKAIINLLNTWQNILGIKYEFNSSKLF